MIELIRYHRGEISASVLNRVVLTSLCCSLVDDDMEVVRRLRQIQKLNTKNCSFYTVEYVKGTRINRDFNREMLNRSL